MSNDLKRVGLVFKEDGAIDFKKSLQNINIEMQKNYNQFKLTQAQWDNSTKTTEKLRAEQEYLKNAYEIQEDKVKALRMKLSDLENAENKNTTAIKKKQNELTNAEIKLENYGKKIKDVEQKLNNTGKKIEEFGQKAEETGKKIEGAGKKVSAFSVATTTALVASAKSAIDFEDAFTGVEKTVDGTEKQMEELKQGIRNMAKEIPSTTTEISAVAEAAGQLGIKTEDILSFTRVMIDLGNSTNLSAEEAASSLAKFANVTKMSAKDYDKLGSTIVSLGNNFATTEADIVAMAQNLASAGTQVGMSQSDIMALATALSSVGLEAQAGGTAFSKALSEIQLAVETNSKDLENWADVAGMSTKDFAKLFKEDATSALEKFIEGLSKCGGETESAIKVLDDMGIKETRMRDALLRSANASETFTKAIKLGSDAWEDNTALTNEANKRYDTLKSKITIAVNKLKDMAIMVGNKLMPSIEKIIDKFGKWIEKFESLSDEQVDMIVKIGLIVAAIGPLLTIIGKATSAFGGVTKGIGTFIEAVQVMQEKTTSTSTAVNGLSNFLTQLTSPVGAAIAATVALTGVVIAVNAEINKELTAEKEKTETIKKQREALEELKKQQEDTMNANLAEIDNVERLKNELTKLVDENGKVKEGYEGRCEFILNELNKALGTEYDLTGDVIQNYKNLTQSIDDVINKKKASIILNTMEESYSNAIKNQAKAAEELGKIQENLNKKLQERAEWEKKLETASEEGGNYSEKQKIKNYINNVLNPQIEQTKASYSEQEKIVKTYYEDIAKYETTAALVQEGTAESIKKVNDSVLYSYADRKDKTIESLNEAINTEMASLNTYKNLYSENQSDITKSQQEESQKRLNTLIQELIDSTSIVDENSPEVKKAWTDLAYGSYSTYYDTISKLPPDLANKIQEMTGVTAEKTPELVEETRKMSQEVVDQIKNNPEFKEEAINNLKGFLQGLKDEDLRQLLYDAGVDNVEEVMKGIKEGDLSEEKGADILENLNNGLSNKNWKTTLWNTARSIASTLSGLLTVKASVNGKTSALPGHKLGLDYVPKDNYVARLHKGERVLTKEENESYTEAEKRSKTSGDSNSIFSTEIDYNKMAIAMTKALTGCKFTLDEDGFAKIVKDELYKVV